MKCGKDFLAACGAIIGTTGLHPRERLTFLVIALLCDESNDYVSRKEICEHTGISTKHISPVLNLLEEKKLVDLKIGAKPLVEMQQCFDKDTNNGCEDTNNGSKDTNNWSNTNNGSKNTQNRHNSEGKPHVAVLPPLSPPSSSPPDPLNNNPPYIPPTHLRARACEDLAAFDELWSNYPVSRRRNREDCKKIFFKALDDGVDAQDILNGLRINLSKWSNEGTHYSYIPHLKTWLNGSRWEPELQIDYEFKGWKPQYTKEEQDFLDTWGKKPFNKVEYNAFKETFARACKEAESASVLIVAAKIAIGNMMASEEGLRFQKKPHRWLDDCDYRPFLKEARGRTIFTKTIQSDIYKIPDGMEL